MPCLGVRQRFYWKIYRATFKTVTERAGALSVVCAVKTSRCPYYCLLQINVATSQRRIFQFVVTFNWILLTKKIYIGTGNRYLTLYNTFAINKVYIEYFSCSLSIWIPLVNKTFDIDKYHTYTYGTPITKLLCKELLFYR